MGNFRLRLSFVLAFLVSYCSYCACEEVCLVSQKFENSTNCLYPARELSENDMDQLLKFCANTTNTTFFKLKGSDIEYNSNYVIYNCSIDLPTVSGNLFWITLPNIEMNLSRLIGRVFSANDTDRISTRIGLISSLRNNIKFRKTLPENTTENFPETEAYEYLTLRLPVRSEVHIMDVSETFTDVLSEKETVGMFAYSNPTEIIQDVQLLVDPKYNVNYNFDFPVFDKRSLIVTDCKTQSETSLNISKIVYNVTVRPHMTVSGPIVGQSLAVHSTFTAIRIDVFHDGENSTFHSMRDRETYNITGKKIEYYFSNFTLEDIQMANSEIYIVSNTTIYIVLGCFGLVLLVGLLVFLIRRCGKHFRNRPKCHYDEISRKYSYSFLIKA